jgi:hypothetical protein
LILDSRSSPPYGIAFAVDSGRDFFAASQRFGFRFSVPKSSEYIVYALSRVTTMPDLMEQRAAFDAMLTRYPADQAEAALGKILSSRE